MFRKWFGKEKEGKPEAPPAETPAAESTGPPAPPPIAEVTPPAVPEGERAAEPGEPAAEKRSRWSIFSRALEKTRSGLKSLFSFRRKLDAALLDEIEAELYTADFGTRVVEELLDGPDGVRAAWKEKRIVEAEDVREFLKSRLKQMLERRETKLRKAPEGPTVILVAGVNGAGKTTSIAKLARRLRNEQKSVILAAGDTFRAAAVEQLTIWSQRLGVEIITGKACADPASVAFRSAEAALEKNADYLIVDTAGRLHTQKNLMRELGKIRSVLEKKIPGSPHECLLVLDATTGQNAISQAKLFEEEIQVTGLILAKLDGTAKGGVVVTINNALAIPVKFVGVGEKIDDLQPFDVDQFVDGIFE
ncbi:MAG TPA: signal recognition particle-docking protein FtsY [Planctomycetota bacterium]|nr:signal recognition particle-docking protein FtsY [Planctomycetota bacterium]